MPIPTIRGRGAPLVLAGCRGRCRGLGTRSGSRLPRRDLPGSRALHIFDAGFPRLSARMGRPGTRGRSGQRMGAIGTSCPTFASKSRRHRHFGALENGPLLTRQTCHSTDLVTRVRFGYRRRPNSRRRRSGPRRGCVPTSPRPRREATPLEGGATTPPEPRSGFGGDPYLSTSAVPLLEGLLRPGVGGSSTV